MNAKSFNCPHCGAFAHQTFEDVFDSPSEKIKTSVCSCCQRHALWGERVELVPVIVSRREPLPGNAARGVPRSDGGKLVYPLVSSAPRPNSDLPEHIKEDYVEAAAIEAQSPRGAAALLRLCIQKLCKYLGKPGQNLNNDIGELVRDGLSPSIQMALDAVRVIGNNAVHPGQLGVADDRELAFQLFALMNVISNQLITQPKEIKSIYDTLPESARGANRQA